MTDLGKINVWPKHAEYQLMADYRTMEEVTYSEDGRVLKVKFRSVEDIIQLMNESETRVTFSDLAHNLKYEIGNE